MAGEATPQRRRVLWLSLGGAVLVVAAILAGVFGSRAASKSNEKASSQAPATVATASVSSSAEQQPYTSLINSNAITVPSTQISLPVVAPTTTATTGSTAAATSTPSPSTSTSPLQQALSTVLGGQSTGSVDGVVSVANTAWKQLGAAGSAICYPRDGKELTSMAQGTACTILVMLNGMFDPVYNISKPINITNTKIIMGNPLNPGIIDAAKSRRAFDVRRGGVLDLRSIQVMRGGAIKSAELRVTQGGGVRVHLGGYFVASGVIFRDQRQTVQGWIADLGDAAIQRGRTFGGHVLVIGGALFLNGCVFAGIRPLGSPVMNNIAVGGQVLIMAGNGVSFGTYHLGANLFGISLVVGGVVAVFEGTYTWVGGGQTNTTPLSASAAVGSSVFVGGGVLVMVGITIVSANGPNFRVGAGTYTVGAGVMIQVGIASASATLVGTRGVAGGTYMVAGGVMRGVGLTSFGTITADAFFGAGGSDMVGGGTYAVTGFPRFGTKTSVFNAGVGHGTFLGGGYAGENAHQVFTGELVRYETGCANDLAVGGGFISYINIYRYTAQLIRVMMGLGVTVWLGAGGAIFFNDYFPSQRILNYIQPQGPGGVNPQVTVGLPTSLNNDFVGGDIPGFKFFFNARKTQELAAVAGPERKLAGAAPTPKLPIIFSKVDFSEYEVNATTLSDAIKTAPECENFFMEPLRCGQALAHAMEDMQETLGDSRRADWSIVNNQESADIIAGCLSGGHSTTTEGYIINNSSKPMNLTLIGPDCRIPAPYDGLETAFGAVQDLHSNIMTRRQLIAGPEKLDNTTLIWYTASAICKSGEPCVPRRSLVTALKDYLKMPLLELAVSSVTFDHPIQVKVLQESPEVKNSIAPVTTATCGEYSVFNIYATVSKKSSADTVASKLDAASNATLYSILASQMREDGSDSELCGISFSKVSVTTYPSLPVTPAFQATSAGLVGPAVVVTANDDIAPSRELIVGQTATVHLLNFVKGNHKVDVYLQKAGDVGDGPLIGSASSFQDNGGDVVKIRAPDTPGSYYLVAKQPDSLYFATGAQVLHVVREHVRRRHRW